MELLFNKTITTISIPPTSFKRTWYGGRYPVWEGIGTEDEVLSFLEDNYPLEEGQYIYRKTSEKGHYIFHIVECCRLRGVE